MKNIILIIFCLFFLSSLKCSDCIAIVFLMAFVYLLIKLIFYIAPGDDDL